MSGFPPIGQLANLSLLERVVRESAVALLLIDAALYVNTVVLWAEQNNITLPATPTAWGDSSPVLAAILVLASFYFVYASIFFLAVLIRGLVVQIPFLRGRSWEKLDEDRNYVSFTDLDTYLRAHEDKPAERVYDEKKRHVVNQELRKNASAVLLTLLVIQNYFVSGTFVQSLATQVPLMSDALWVAYLLLFLAAFRTTPDYTYLPGNRVREHLYALYSSKPENLPKRPTSFSDDEL